MRARLVRRLVQPAKVRPRTARVVPTRTARAEVTRTRRKIAEIEAVPATLVRVRVAAAAAAAAEESAVRDAAAAAAAAAAEGAVRAAAAAAAATGVVDGETGAAAAAMIGGGGALGRGLVVATGVGAIPSMGPGINKRYTSVICLFAPKSLTSKKSSASLATLKTYTFRQTTIAADRKDLAL